MAITFDGASKLILLDGATTVSIRAIYSRWVDWAASNLHFLPAFAVIADPPTVPVYATLLNGWKVKPLAGSYTLTLNDGFLYDGAAGDPITSSGGIEPRIRYQNPVIAVGYATGESPQQADIDAIRAVTDALTIEAGRILADIRAVRGIDVNGTGTAGDPWGP